MNNPIEIFLAGSKMMDVIFPIASLLIAFIVGFGLIRTVHKLLRRAMNGAMPDRDEGRMPEFVTTFEIFAAKEIVARCEYCGQKSDGKSSYCKYCGGPLP